MNKRLKTSGILALITWLIIVIWATIIFTYLGKVLDWDLSKLKSFNHWTWIGFLLAMMVVFAILSIIVIALAIYMILEIKEVKKEQRGTVVTCAVFALLIIMPVIGFFFLLTYAIFALILSKKVISSSQSIPEHMLHS